jgi:hypothetical protein
MLGLHGGDFLISPANKAAISRIESARIIQSENPGKRLAALPDKAQTHKSMAGGVLWRPWLLLIILYEHIKKE